MLKDQCVSVTDLRTKTKECLENVEKMPKFIFINNHPIAVLLGISEYEEKFLNAQLIEMPTKEVTTALAAQARKAKRTKKSSLVNLS